MIDDKKIEETAIEYLTILCREKSYSLDVENKYYNSFKEGAKWAIEQFLKDLWHPASKKPILRKGKCLVIYNCGKIDIFEISFVFEMLSNYGKDGMGWKCWCYVSDLLPKKGGNHD